MRKEFNKLVDVMQKFDIYQLDDEVGIALNDLSDKITEVEKRMICAVKSAKEINETISKYTEEVDKSQPIFMTVSDHDLIQNCSNDVDIALDMGEDMCVVDNWYNLFSPTEELKPIAVGNIEYDFPEEVYTIGNADNTEIIGDVYESAFHEFLDLGILVLEDSNDFTSGKTNYIVLDNKFISIVKKKQIDLSKVPIINKEIFMTFHSSWGEIDCDEDGKVIEVRGDEEYNGERNYLFDIAVFDLPTYFVFLNSKNITMGEADDILVVGYWNKDNTYNEADMDLRKDVFSPEADEEPTKKESAFEFESSCGTIECDIDGRVLRVNGDLEISGRRNWLFDIIKFDIEEYSKYCSKHNITHGESLDIFTVGYWKINDEYIMADDFFRDNAIGAKTELSKEKLVNDIISQLKAIDVDGETMEYILKQVGMEAQMLRQLFVKTTNDEIDELIDERILYNRYSNHLV